MLQRVLFFVPVFSENELVTSLVAQPRAAGGGHAAVKVLPRLTDVHVWIRPGSGQVDRLSSEQCRTFER